MSSSSSAADLSVGSGGAQDIMMSVDKPGEYTAKCRWTVESFPRVKAKALSSKYFDVGGYDCRLLVYPRGDSQALPGYISIYLQIIDPRGTNSSLWDCFASYRLSIFNHVDDSLTIHKDSWHRFSSKKRSHGWCDFTLKYSILDPKMGFLFNNDSLLITADILILNESVSCSLDKNNEENSIASPMPDVLNGKFTWKVHNFSLFKEMMKTQKITSPVFPAGECNLRISVSQSEINSQEYISINLESNDTEKTAIWNKSSWCFFRIKVLNQKPECNHMHRDSYGSFTADNKRGDNTSLGWNDYMKMSDFSNPEAGFLLDDTAVFSTSFHVIKEFSSFTKNGGLIGGRNGTGDGHMGKFTWRIENFTRLKDLLKKRKITGLYIKSHRFQIGNRDCRLIVYPRGQSQPPCHHLSLFLEVTDSRSSSDWSCFVSHRLSVVNRRLKEKSVTKESQNRYSKAAKEWGWPEFVTLANLFDQDSGFVVQDYVVFSAEVLILKETSATSVSQIDNSVTSSSFTWKMENFLDFKEVIQTGEIFSKFFQAGVCDLRIGVYESFDTICIYLESNQSAGTDVDNNLWVKYKFMKVSDMLEADAGFLVRDTVVFVCEILECCPWFEFSVLEVLASDDDQDALTTDPDDIIDSEESEGISGDEEDTFRDFLSRAGFHLTFGENSSQPQVTLREKLLMDAGEIVGFLTGLRVYLDDPTSSSHDLDSHLEILDFLIFQEQEVGRPVLAMLKKVVEHANIDRADLRHQLRANKEELVRLKEEKKTEIQSMTKEKSSITQKLSEFEAANTRLKSEMKAEMDRFAREKKGLVEQSRDVESQLELIRSERQDDSSEKKTLLDRLHEAETQIALLNTRNRDNLKKVGKEKSALTEKLKLTEAARKRSEEELKRYATENVTLEDQIRQLTETVWQTKEEKREKEVQITRCEDTIDEMDTKLQACQQRIHTLESSLQEEKREKEQIARCETCIDEMDTKLQACQQRIHTLESSLQEEKREKEEQIARCETYIDEMDSKLQASQQRIHTLESSLQEEKREKEEQIARCETYIEEMDSKLQASQQRIHTLESSLQAEKSNRALYVTSLESLVMKELDTINSSDPWERVRQIHPLKQHISRIHEEGLRQIHALQQRMRHTLSHGLPQGHTLYPTTPASASSNGDRFAPSGVHSEGNINDLLTPWFSHHT